MEQLKRDEGIRASVYQDSLGYWTIGIGTCIDARAGCGLTLDEMELLAHNRLQSRYAALSATISSWDSLDPIRQDCLVNMSYQLGVTGLLEFKSTLAALALHDYALAASHMLDSKWAREDSPARAKRLAQQMLTGEYV